MIKHTFLIDDDAMINMINTRIIHLSKLAVKVSSATDAKEALKTLTEMAECNPDIFPEIIFLDINMPDMDGWEFLDEFANFPENVLQKCSVIMLSSSIDFFDIKKAKKYTTVKDYIIKPLDLKALAMLGSPKHKYFSISQSAVNAI